jgi:hypothetical protein
MEYKEVKYLLAQPDVAALLAKSFGSPIKEAEAVLNGQPSFERCEWGRVNGSWDFEPETVRDWRVHNGIPLSTAERRQYTVRQWGVVNTQSYSFIAVFDENDVLVCRWLSVPSETWIRGWIRNKLGF